MTFRFWNWSRLLMTSQRLLIRFRPWFGLRWLRLSATGSIQSTHPTTMTSGLGMLTLNLSRLDIIMAWWFAEFFLFLFLGARTAPQWAQLQVWASLVDMELCDWEPERGSDRPKLLPSSVSQSNSFPRTGNTPQVCRVQNSCYKCSLNQRWVRSRLDVIYTILDIQM